MVDETEFLIMNIDHESRLEDREIGENYDKPQGSKQQEFT